MSSLQPVPARQPQPLQPPRPDSSCILSNPRQGLVPWDATPGSTPTLSASPLVGPCSLLLAIALRLTLRHILAFLAVLALLAVLAFLKLLGIRLRLRLHPRHRPRHHLDLAPSRVRGHHSRPRPLFKETRGESTSILSMADCPLSTHSRFRRYGCSTIASSSTAMSLQCPAPHPAPPKHSTVTLPTTPTSPLCSPGSGIATHSRPCPKTPLWRSSTRLTHLATRRSACGCSTHLAAASIST
mmetsp:Transcript_38102/g.86398  ORF Transcript_38102/g.86398 Transcript_38102/m.86398 type:complete len:241 (+) Transcript_38102:543-1265(+)